MKKIVFALLVMYSISSTAQDTQAVAETEPKIASVIIHKDPRIEVLVKKQSSINTATKKSSARTARGYRLLVINTNKRDEAIAAKTRIYTLFPELNPYMSYQSPYFRVKAGNFKTRDEAVRYQKVMNTMFPKGVFIINDIIEIKGEKDDSLE